MRWKKAKPARAAGEVVAVAVAMVALAPMFAKVKKIKIALRRLNLFTPVLLVRVMVQVTTRAK